MTSSEFIIWLKGFTEGVHDFNITPKQWDLLKEKLAEVRDKTLILVEAEPYRTSGCLPASYVSSNTSTTFPLNTNITYTTTTTSLVTDEEELNRRMDIIGSNGNEGLHYNIEEDGE